MAAGSVLISSSFRASELSCGEGPLSPCPPPHASPVRMAWGRLHLQDVVSGAVAIVADANLCAHVPAAEGTGAELQAADLQEHVGHSGEAVPLQSKVLEPLEPVESNTAQLAVGCGTGASGEDTWAGSP